MSSSLHDMAEPSLPIYANGTMQAKTWGRRVSGDKKDNYDYHVEEGRDRGKLEARPLICLLRITRRKVIKI